VRTDHQGREKCQTKIKTNRVVVANQAAAKVARVENLVAANQVVADRERKRMPAAVVDRKAADRRAVAAARVEGAAENS